MSDAYEGAVIKILFIIVRTTWRHMRIYYIPIGFLHSLDEILQLSLVNSTCSLQASLFVSVIHMGKVCHSVSAKL